MNLEEMRQAPQEQMLQGCQSQRHQEEKGGDKGKDKGQQDTILENQSHFISFRYFCGAQCEALELSQISANMQKNQTQSNSTICQILFSLISIIVPSEQLNMTTPPTTWPTEKSNPENQKQQIPSLNNYKIRQCICLNYQRFSLNLPQHFLIKIIL